VPLFRENRRSKNIGSRDSERSFYCSRAFGGKLEWEERQKETRFPKFEVYYW